MGRRQSLTVAMAQTGTHPACLALPVCAMVVEGGTGAAAALSVPIGVLNGVAAPTQTETNR